MFNSACLSCKVRELYHFGPVGSVLIGKQFASIHSNKSERYRILLDLTWQSFNGFMTGAREGLEGFRLEELIYGDTLQNAQ